jgi:hypothetical protein
VSYSSMTVSVASLPIAAPPLFVSDVEILLSLLSSPGSLSLGWMVLDVHFEHLRRLQQQDDGKGFRFNWVSKSYCSKL